MLTKWSERTRPQSNHDRLFSHNPSPNAHSDIEGIMSILSSRTTETKTHESNAFDDYDFYHKKVLETIIARSSSSSNQPLISTATKKRRKKAQGEGVDTKASKGRKMWYEVHEKLVHFMVPAFSEGGGGGGWHVEQVDELFGFLPGGGL